MNSGRMEKTFEISSPAALPRSLTWIRRRGTRRWQRKCSRPGRGTSPALFTTTRTISMRRRTRDEPSIRWHPPRSLTCSPSSATSTTALSSSDTSLWWGKKNVEIGKKKSLKDNFEDLNEFLWLFFAVAVRPLDADAFRVVSAGVRVVHGPGPSGHPRRHVLLRRWARHGHLVRHRIQCGYHSG